jgi:hypothetical protein
VPLRATVKSLAKRLLLICLAAVVVDEAFARLTLHWRESEQENWLLPFLALSIAAAMWAAKPVLRQPGSWKDSVFPWLGTSALLWGSLWVFALFHMAYLGPNLGLYTEPDWMVQNAGWQRQRRIGLAKWLWKRTRVAPEFGTTRELTLSLDSEQQVGLADLDTGRLTYRNGADAGETIEWARSGKFDAIAWIKAGRLSVEGLALARVPVSDHHWEDSPQNVADYFLLEWQKPKVSTTLWPLADHWSLEQEQNRSSLPAWMMTNNLSTFYFRTREGRMGVLQITGVTGEPLSVQLRTKLVRDVGAVESESAPPTALASPVPPVVINTVPESGAMDVDPALTELRVTFSKPMRQESFGWIMAGGAYPETREGTHRWQDERTSVLPVKLEPGKVYTIWINREDHQKFRERFGLPAVPYLLIFQTRK